MPPHQTWNSVYPNWGGNALTLLNSTPPGVPHSPYPVNQQLLPFPAPHLLQPPPAPRLRPVPLPDLRLAHRRPRAPPAHQDPFPIDLSTDVDFDLLANALTNYDIPAHTIIDILPASRDCVLLQINTGDRPMTTFSVIRTLQTVMQAPLLLQVFRAELPPAAKLAVQSYFLSRSGRHGARLWQGFLNGSSDPQGPRGAVLLRGHCCMWGFSPDHQGRWILYVDVPPVPLV